MPKGAKNYNPYLHLRLLFKRHSLCSNNETHQWTHMGATFMQYAPLGRRQTQCVSALLPGHHDLGRAENTQEVRLLPRLIRAQGCRRQTLFDFAAEMLISGAGRVARPPYGRKKTERIPRPVNFGRAWANREETGGDSGKARSPGWRGGLGAAHTSVIGKGTGRFQFSRANPEPQAGWGRQAQKSAFCRPDYFNRPVSS